MIYWYVPDASLLLHTEIIPLPVSKSPIFSRLSLSIGIIESSTVSSKKGSSHAVSVLNGEKEVRRYSLLISDFLKLIFI
jgi:hypothetical protein